jgi:thiol-disulfide isomerase/thioredoxin
MPYLRYFSALSKLADTAEVELIAAGDQLIAINHKRPGRYLRTPAVIDVARAYVERGIRLDAVPGMTDTGLREADSARWAPESDLFDWNHRMNEQFRYESRVEARKVQFDWSVKTSRMKDAHAALVAMRKDVDGLLAVATTLGRYPQMLDADYWTKMAQLAELEGKAQDAAEYRRAANNASHAPSGVEEMPESAKAAGKHLPPFRATGVDGRAWTAADLDGKVAVMSIWATWCGPCIEELKHIQKLHELLKDRPDIVLVSLNVDANPGVVNPFLKGRGLTFPVLLAHDYVNSVLPEMSIPRNWIVESGVVRSEDVGFDDAEAWMRRILAKVDEAQQQH